MTMDDIDRPLVGLRDQFLLRPGVVFLNHGSFGACPRPVFEEYQAWQLELERQPVEFVQRRSRELLHEAREALGDFVGADADDLVYIGSEDKRVYALDKYTGDGLIALFGLPVAHENDPERAVRAEPRCGACRTPCIVLERCPKGRRRAEPETTWMLPPPRTGRTGLPRMLSGAGAPLSSPRGSPRRVRSTSATCARCSPATRG